MRRANFIAGLTVVAGIAAGTFGLANAGTLNVQGAAGHLWNAAGMGTLQFSDAAVCSTGVNATNVWFVPVPLSVTGTSYSGQQFSSFFANVCTRLISFTSSNQVFDLPPAQTCVSGPIAPAFVPTDGMLVAQTIFFSTPTRTGCLHGIRFTF